ncbi:hypothetical protein ACIA5C_47175 [Actinoplanes sp. NPDC051343]|uniref:RipA family octameric membrane protein n=1 Tax=Actinoplanes sp. NPDC051343 TaxID=3363906 RepID=UPI00379C3055
MLGARGNKRHAAREMKAMKAAADYLLAVVTDDGRSADEAVNRAGALPCQRSSRTASRRGRSHRLPHGIPLEKRGRSRIVALHPYLPRTARYAAPSCAEALRKFVVMYILIDDAGCALTIQCELGAGTKSGEAMEQTADTNHDIEILKLVHSHFDQDLRQFWVRGNMFLIVTGVLVSTFAATAAKSEYSLVIAAFGLIVSLFWFAVARASYLWICAWRDELCRLDDQVDRFKSISRVERLPLRPFASASGITRWFPIVVAVGWLIILSGSLGR